MQTLRCSDSKTVARGTKHRKTRFKRARQDFNMLPFFCAYGSQFRIAVREHQRQAREADHQAVRQSSENYEVMMMQSFQSIQKRHEVRLEEDERRVAQVIGSEARDARRGRRSQKVACTSSSSSSRRKRKSSRKAICSRSYSHRM